MVGFSAHRPAGMQRWQQELLVQVAQDVRDAGRKIVVEQDGARVEVLESDAAVVAHQRFHHQGRIVRHLDGRRLGDRRVERADAHVQSGLAHDFRQASHILQVEGVARVVLRDQQQVLRIRADLLDRRHGGLHAQGLECRVQVVEATGEEIHVHRRQLETGIAQVHRAVDRRGVFLPLAAKPVFDRARSVEDALLQVLQRSGQCGGQVRNHVCASNVRVDRVAFSGSFRIDSGPVRPLRECT